MRIQNSTNSSANPYFGMAVSADIKSIEQSFGPKVAKSVKDSIPEIKKFSNDVDIVIRAFNKESSTGKNNVILYEAREKGVSLIKKIKSYLKLRRPTSLKLCVFPEDASLSAQKAKKAKEILLSFDKVKWDKANEPNWLNKILQLQNCCL